MRIRSYRITSDAPAAIEAAEDFLKDWHRGKESYWVDLDSYEPEELKAWLENLDVSNMAMKLCLEAGRSTRYLPLKKEMFFELPDFSEGLGAEPIYLSFLCLENLVISLHPVPLQTIAMVQKGLMSDVPLARPNIAALICALLVLVSAASLKLSVDLKRAVFKLDDRMDDNPDSVAADDILDLKRSLRSIDDVSSAQLRCFEFLAGFRSPFLDLGTLAPQFQLATSDAASADRILDHLEKTIADLHQRYEMNQQEKTNHRLAILTILSAIFMPLTFIAGIYGMNFDKMPELHIPHAYPIVLGIMALIAIGMFLFFKTRGWLE